VPVTFTLDRRDAVAKTLTISFAATVNVGSDLVHRVRNFAEDLDRGLRVAGIGVVENPDTAVDSVVVRIEHATRMGDALAIARSEVKRHHLEDDACYERHVPAAKQKPAV